MSCVIFLFFIFLKKRLKKKVKSVVKLASGGLVINGANPSS